ncbi:epoxide hydrolase 1 [Nocardia cyriacigeorgica]|uniref:Epoxide hydrolase 1 n=1 Tax=Nocardia cyriacigeorgica TaxID=135487 RepID=A0A6P1D276_9NOCA|nr:epoxide hydrolase family protein [Nocardia cyriacigeorgica]NEW44108.1 epoxide hydrolase 1 [Nocardia cyriacigeorgica]NEW56291.1 epoxide hydrolase 1 [Nocardia cyriacigeorgica]
MSEYDIHPFRIEIPQQRIDQLHARLADILWPDDRPDVGWDKGMPVSYLRSLAEYWRTEYDWRAHEARLNELPQFVTEIEGLQVHFVHVRSPEPGALPLVLSHGWPGTFTEFLDVIGPLSDPRSHGGDPADAFHVVVPSLPGFAFSGVGPKDGDGSTEHYAKVVARLMDRLGYDRYGAQGGDAGYFVSTELGRIATDYVVGIHVNGPITMPSWDGGDEWSGDSGDSEWSGETGGGDQRAAADNAVGETLSLGSGTTEFSQEDQATLAKLTGEDSYTRFGYAMVQAGRPQTLAIALHDSPVGLLSWIVDMFQRWTNPAIEVPDDAVGRDALLTNVSLYWFTRTFASSIRLYGEGEAWGGALPNSGVPTAAAIFPGDLSIRAIAEQQHNIVRWNEFDRGGHFAAMEAPDLLTDDVREFFRTLR